MMMMMSPTSIGTILVPYLQHHYGRLDVLLLFLPKPLDRQDTTDIMLPFVPLLQKSTAPPKCIYIIDSTEDTCWIHTLLKDYPSILCHTMQSSSTLTIQQVTETVMGWITHSNREL
jgi:hypothetical protein